jgi:5-formyltetrahydrofolate cyclo-ligase
MEEKKELRKQMLFKRAKLDKQEKEKYDQWICEKLWALITQQNYKKVHIPPCL